MTMSGELKASGGNWNICWETYNGTRCRFSITTQPHGSCRPVANSGWRIDEGVENTEELQANAHLLRSARELYEALGSAAEYMNILNNVVQMYLVNKMTDDEFITRCIQLSDGDERRKVAAQMNSALKAARGE
jgi:hypothetical protein